MSPERDPDLRRSERSPAGPRMTLGQLVRPTLPVEDEEDPADPEHEPGSLFDTWGIE